MKSKGPSGGEGEKITDGTRDPERYLSFGLASKTEPDVCSRV